MYRGCNDVVAAGRDRFNSKIWRFIMRERVKILVCSLAFVGCLGLTSDLSNAQDTKQMTQELHKACLADMSKFCSSVNLGEGRMMACLYAHEDQITEDCDSAMADTADVLDSFLSNVAAALDNCAEDIEKTCSAVEFGSGRILSCLKQNSSKVSADCKDSAGQLTEFLAD